NATATWGAASAYASHYYYALYQYAYNAASSTVDVTNSGTFNITRDARAVGTSNAYASVYNSSPLFYQYASANASAGSVASAILANSGNFSLLANAYASAPSGTATADASNYYTQIYQYAGNADSATASITNSSSLTIAANAWARGDQVANATAHFSEPAIYQSANSVNNQVLAHSLISNTGTFLIGGEADARAKMGGSAIASANIDSGIDQRAYSGNDTLTSLTNSSTMMLWNKAYASVTGSSGYAYANATLSYAIYQSAIGNGSGVTTALLDNSGTLTLLADADAIAGDTATAYAYLYNSPIYQSATGDATVLASINNTGTMLLMADAYAQAFDAYAYASASTVLQTVAATPGGSATASFTNSSAFTMSAVAKTLGQHAGQSTTTALATAYAYAYGIHQGIAGGGDPTATLKFHNSSSFTVHALATASANAGTAANTSYAYAYARGLYGYADTGQIANLDFNNTGDFYVGAYAKIGGTGSTAGAYASGIFYYADSMTGTFSNSSNIMVVASSVRVDSLTSTAPASTPIGTATAIALQIYTDSAGADFNNTGTLSAYAIAAAPQATAVSFGDHGGGGTQTANFTNDGGTVSAMINDGTFVMHGYAFMSEGASYPVMLNWQGSSQDGSIFGHAEIKSTDMIYVTNGTTWFDGIVNPDDVNEGSLDIFNNGKLVLVNNPTLGPSEVNIDTFTVQSDGTLGLQIDPLLSSSVDANTATLAGTIMVTALPALYASSQTYANVIDAGARIGTFDTEMINTPLLDLSVIYDGNTVDLAVTRNAFDSIAGLTPNQMSVAGAIESSYSTGLGGGYGGLIMELFGLDEEGYTDALDQLSGVEYAGALQAATGSFNQFLDAINQRVNTAHENGTSTNGFVNALFAGNTPANDNSGWWVRVQGGWADQDGDGNASGYSYNEVSALIGVDAQVNDYLMIGIAGGLYAPGDIDFDNGNTVSQDAGYQIGAYAQYDTGQYYVRGFVGYGAWDATATRMLSIGALSGVNTSTFDVSAWNVSGEGGYSFNRGNYVITPYGGLSYTHASLSNYMETGFAAAALAGSGDADQLDGYVGVRFSGMNYKVGNVTIMPEAAFGFVYNFSDEATVTNTFLAAPAGTSSFTILGPEHGGAGFVDLSASMMVYTNTTLSLGYLGEYGSTHQEHSAFGKLKMNF
ncbi:MAG: autotransporter outer membrane beta-barrel domain-containing protein, partial [Hyphomicrobiales bacterium]|nr:autotransporter outer membrane beta-barrel domain-containing protein [Hyphomicrobiales bacterium]